MRVLVLLAVLGACKDRPPPAPGEVAERGWTAYERVITAGEHATTCREAGAAMQQAYAANRQAFVDAFALDRDKDRLRIATEWLESHGERFADLEPRMDALKARCPVEASVQAVFREMESP